jgi:hypothetical protein
MRRFRSTGHVRDKGISIDLSCILRLRWAHEREHAIAAASAIADR